MTPSEEWRQIPDFPGYEASSLGRVRSWRGNHGERRAQPRILTPKIDRHGYLKLGLYRPDRTRKTIGVHTLVAAAFNGPKPVDPRGPMFVQVCHNDDVKTNNTPWNLRYDTAAANVADAIEHGKHGSLSKLRTHCVNGHEYTPENTRYNQPATKTGRCCRTCRTETNKRQWVRHKAQRDQVA